MRGSVSGVCVSCLALAGVEAMSNERWGVHAERAGLGTGRPDWYTLSAEMVKQHEGWRTQPYRDSLGNWTFGWGFLMDEDDEGHPLYMPSEEDGEALLEVRLRTAFWDAAIVYKGSFGLLDTTRQAVLVDMAYQLGRGGLASFVKFRAAVGRKDWPAAKQEMLDSRWAGQTPRRANELAELMLNGDE